MSEVKLGELIEGDQQRDAIHVAIVPVVADEFLRPGEHVGFTEDGLFSVKAKCIGIVDPFLKVNVQPKERFWLFLYPNTVTGMRHHWSHPAFEPAASDKTASEAWMEEFAAKHNAPYENDRTYSSDELIEAGREYLRSGERMVQQGSQSLRDYTTAGEFWEHYQVITGELVSEGSRHDNPFCCTC